MLPFRVGQIARVTQLVTLVQRAVFGGPHAGSRGCSPTGTHRGVEPVKQIYPPAVTDSNDSQSLRTDTKESLRTTVHSCLGLRPIGPQEGDRRIGFETDAPFGYRFERACGEG